MFDLPVMDHCQDYSLVTDGVVHEGYWSAALGLRGWPACGEELIVARNILLAELTGARVALPASERGGERAIAARRPQARGVHSGEACPHHFTLTDSALAAASNFGAGRAELIAAGQGFAELAFLRYDLKHESAGALRGGPRGADRRAGGRDGGDNQQRPRAALRL